MTGEPEHIKQLIHFDGLDQIFIGNDESLSIYGVGSSFFVSPHDSHITFKLNNLLHVPSIPKNLLKCSPIAKDDFVFLEFHPDKCLVKYQGKNKVLFQGIIGVNELHSFHNLNILISAMDGVHFLLSVTETIGA